MAAPAQRDAEKPEIRFGLLYGIVISVLVEYGMLKFFLAIDGGFSRIEDYIQLGLGIVVTLFFGVLGVRYAVLFAGDLRRRD